MSQDGFEVGEACSLFGYSRQAYYQNKKDHIEYLRRESRIIIAAREIRSEDPGISTYKVWLMIKDMFDSGWVPGRDSFYNLMYRYGLRLPTAKPRTTTNSNHRYRTYKNLIVNFEPLSPNQLWVADITYIDCEEESCYLHLLTDAYSHKIIGWCLATSLEAVHTIEALQMALRECPLTDFSGLIHHSDRGSQYCSNGYTNILKELGVQISMTEDYNPTNNAIAERVNGIIKTEVIYREKRFATVEQARERIGRFITFYNERRPHMSIGYQTPNVAHQQTGEQKRMWKKKTYPSCRNEEKVLSLQPETIAEEVSVQP